jgi:hypothetical protein
MSTEADDGWIDGCSHTHQSKCQHTATIHPIQSPHAYDPSPRCPLLFPLIIPLQLSVNGFSSLVGGRPSIKRKEISNSIAISTCGYRDTVALRPLHHKYKHILYNMTHHMLQPLLLSCNNLIVVLCYSIDCLVMDRYIIFGTHCIGLSILLIIDTEIPSVYLNNTCVLNFCFPQFAPGSSLPLALHYPPSTHLISNWNSLLLLFNSFSFFLGI